MGAGVNVAWTQNPLNWAISYTSFPLFIVIPAARAFLTEGQPSVLMLGSGVLVMELGAAAKPIGFAYSSNAAMTIYNSLVFISALCHLGGVALTAWRPTKLRQAAMWLTVSYAGVTVHGKRIFRQLIHFLEFTSGNY